MVTFPSATLASITFAVTFVTVRSFPPCFAFVTLAGICTIRRRSFGFCWPSHSCSFLCGNRTVADPNLPVVQIASRLNV